jgi:hypothetical protein
MTHMFSVVAIPASTVEQSGGGGHIGGGGIGLIFASGQHIPA